MRRAGRACYASGMDAALAQLPTIIAVIATGAALWRSMSNRLDRIEHRMGALETRMDRHLEWHAQK